MKVSIVKYIVDKLKRSLAIVQDGDTATRNIASGKYVCWKGNMYTANQAIASGSTLSAASGGNLTSCDDGALNKIGNDITAINSKFSADPLSVSSIDTLKSALLAKANGMAQYETKFVTFWISAATTGFSTGKNYSGTITISSKTSNSLYFDVVLSAYNGDIVIVGYANGTWNINSLNSKIDTKPTMESITVPAKGSIIIPLGQGGKRGTLSNYSANNANMGMWSIYITTTGAYFAEIKSSTNISLESVSTGLKISNAGNSAASMYALWCTNNDL